MTHLRDARLQRAMALAPDAHLLPSVRVRELIHAAAREALAPAVRPGWRRFWPRPSRSPMPWNAAFATLMLASLVTLLWHDREILGARPQSAPSDQPASAAVAPGEMPVKPSEAFSTATSQRPSVLEPPRDEHERGVRQSSKVAPAPAPAALEKSQATPVLNEAARKRGIEATAPAMIKDSSAQQDSRRRMDSANVPLVPELSAPSVASTNPSMNAEIAMPLPAAKPAAAPVAAMSVPKGAAGAPATAAAAAAPNSLSRSQPFSVDGATHVRITSQGRSVDVALEKSPRLALLLNRAVREARSFEPLGALATVRAELRRQHELIGVLELAGPQIRWTPTLDAEKGGLTARPDDALLQALREELGGLLAR